MTFRWLVYGPDATVLGTVVAQDFDAALGEAFRHFDDQIVDVEIEEGL